MQPIQTWYFTHFLNLVPIRWKQEIFQTKVSCWSIGVCNGVTLMILEAQTTGCPNTLEHPVLHLKVSIISTHR